LALLVAVGTAASGANTSATLKVQVNKPGHAVPPSLWGIFFEEINHAGDGGLYAELVRNRSFEDSDKPERWEAVGGASLAIVPRVPESRYNKRVLSLVAGKAGEGAENGGYWGMAVRKDAAYVLSVTAKAGPAYKGGLSFALVSASGRTLGSGSIPKLGNAWKEYTLKVTASATDAKASLRVTLTQPGSVFLDYVSLFPSATWKKRPNGLNPGLAKALDDLKPNFVRFPGGCWVEGETMATASRWKRTIGPVRERWTQWNLWQYWSTNGLGYHEYLQMCEDLGAEALFVINCGMSHREVVPMDQMDEFVQDALDAIEYANGPVTSKWGAVRAANGHPKPFKLRYVEIGNENGGPNYNERYALFYDAITKKYPDIQIVACVWGGTPNSRPTPIIDEHYYNSPSFFISNAGKYDTYDRSGPKIYVGEYAVTQGTGQGSLRGALGEAAFMTGMERNSDIVTMSSYAPLFANLNFKRWNPDLIYFDSSRVALTPSYHVQRMFSTNRPDVVLPTDVATGSDIVKGNDAGAIGLATWDTQAEFDDVKVTAPDGTVLFEDDFSAGAGKWKAYGGSWNVENGVMRQSAGGSDLRLVAGDPSWKDYTITLKARRIGGDEGFIVMFRVANEDNWLWANYGGWGNSRHRLERSLDGSKEAIGRDSRGNVEDNRWYDVKVEVAGDQARMYLDGRLIDEVRFPPVAVRPLHVVSGYDRKAGEVVMKVVNVTSAACDGQVSLAGVGNVAPSGTALTLTGDPADENTLENPDKVKPVKSTFKAGGPEFRYTFPPNSLTVLRVRAIPL
jgi:alpha-L-arabinofuranosidase